MNELLFLFHVLLVGIATAIMASLAKEALCAFLCVQALLANLFILKQITLFGFTATASDVYIVGSVFTLNIIQEYYGKSVARQTIWISFSLLIFYIGMSQMHLAYLPAVGDFSNNAYASLLSFMPRIVAASMLVYLIVQYFDTYFYALLKRKFNSNYLLLRNGITTTTSQLLDTLLFSFLGLYGIVQDLTSIMLVSFSIKLITIFLLLPILNIIHKRIKVS